MEFIVKGLRVLIDDQDFDVVSKYTWRISTDGYPISHHKRDSGGYRTILMHRLILDLIHCRYPLVDHKNKNRLDNRRENLRVATYGDNARNRKCSGEIKYLGVRYIRPMNGRYQYIGASIRVDGKSVHLGTFDTIELAARAYNEAAKKYFGEFANLNVIG